MKKTLLLILSILIYWDTNAQSKIEELKSLSNIKLIEEGNQLTEIRLSSISHDTVSLNDLRGKYVFINFWATWCLSCLENMPYFKQLIEENKNNNIEFVMISIDESKEKWQKYVVENKLPGIHLFANGDKSKPVCYFLNRVYEENGIVTSVERGVPRYIIIDPKGIIVENDLEKMKKEKITEFLNDLVR